MGRVLLTDWESPIAAALVRALLADPGYDVRVLALEAPPPWVAESCEIVRAALPDAEHLRGCEALVDLVACRPVERAALADSALTLGSAWQSAAGASAFAACEAGIERIVHVGALAGTLQDAGPAADAARGAAALVTAAQAQAGISACVLWPFGPLSAEIDERLPGSPGIFARALDACAAGRAPELPDEPWRAAFTAVEDLASAIMAALASDAGGSYDLAGGWRPDAQELAQLAAELTGAAASPPVDERQPAAYTRERRPDRAGARRAFDFAPRGTPEGALAAIAASRAPAAVTDGS